MKSISIITNKELKRVFGDPKLLFTTLILPMLMMVVIYGLMFFFIAEKQKDIIAHKSTVIVNNAPVSFESFLADKTDLDVEFTQNSDVSLYRDAIQKGTLDLYIHFPNDFEDHVKKSIFTNIEYSYNPAEEYSDAAGMAFVNKIFPEYKEKLLIDRYGSIELVKVFDLMDKSIENGTVNEEKNEGKFLAQFLPLVLSISLFASAMGQVIETVAGEKERGTIGMMLMAPIRREAIAYGKLFALSILTIFSALSSLLGILILYLLVYFTSPVVMNNLLSGLSYGVPEYLMLVFIVIQMVLIIVSLLIILSAIAKNIKEASSMVMAPYMLIMMCSMMITMSTGAELDLVYLIPGYAHIAAIKELLLFTLTPIKIALMSVSTVVTIILMAAILRSVFNNENMVSAE